MRATIKTHDALNGRSGSTESYHVSEDTYDATESGIYFSYRPVSTIGCLGDSISDNAGVVNWNTAGDHYLPKLEFLTNARVQAEPSGCYASSGLSAPEIATTWLPSAVAGPEDIIVIHAGTNSNVATTAENKAAIITMTETLVEAGKTVILSTLMPHESMDAERSIKWYEFNEWIRQYSATAPNTFLADFNIVTVAQFTDPTLLPVWIDGLDLDGTHPSVAGYWVMAEVLADVVNSMPNLAVSSRPGATDTRYIPNVLMVGTAGDLGLASGEVATSWAVGSGAAATATFSKVARASGIKSDTLNGEWQQATIATGDTDAALRAEIPELVSGKTYDIYAEISIDSAATPQPNHSACLRVTGAAGATKMLYLLFDASAAGKTGVGRIRFTATATGQLFVLLLPGEWDGITQFGSAWVRELD